MNEITIVDTETGEVTVRPLSKDELKQREIDAELVEAKRQAAADLEAKRIQALAKLDALGLTAEDLKSLGL